MGTWPAEGTSYPVTPRRRVVRGAFPERGSKPGKALCKGRVWPCPPGIPAPSQPRSRGKAGLAPFTERWLSFRLSQGSEDSRSTGPAMLSRRCQRRPRPENEEADGKHCGQAGGWVAATAWRRGGSILSRAHQHAKGHRHYQRA